MKKRKKRIGSNKKEKGDERERKTNKGKRGRGR